MRDHLLQMVEELKSQGKTEDESVSIAIKDFGDKAQVESELLDTFKLENKAAKVALFIGLIFLLISAALIAANIFESKHYLNEYNTVNNEVYNTLSTYDQNNIEKINKYIGSEIDKSDKRITFVAMFLAHKGQDIQHQDLKDLVYRYPKDYETDYIIHSECTYRQVISKNGNRYNVEIGEVQDALNHKHIQHIRNSCFVCILCSVISIIFWIFIKFDCHITFID